MSDILRWRDKVEQAVKTLAFDKSKDVQDDLRQECYLTLLQERVDGPGHAYRICENRILHVLGRKPKVEKLESSASLPAVVQEADAVAAAAWKDPALLMDSETVVTAVDGLPQAERFVIIWLFGLKDEESQTEEEVASRMGKSRAWVHRTKETALRKLRSILGAKNAS